LNTTFVDREAPSTLEAEEAVYRLAAIVSSSDDGIVSKDLNGIVTSWNAGAERIFGYTSAEMIGQSIRRIIPADRQGEEDEVLARVRAGDRVDHFDTVRQRKDGSLVDISLSVSPVRDRRGRIIGASKVARDISDRKRAEELARESMTLKDQFLSMVSHELRTPISTVLGNGQLLLRLGDKLEESDKRQALLDIVSETERLQRIIENLLVLSRIDAGRELNPEPVSLPHLVQDAAEAFSRRSRGRNAEVRVEPVPPVASAEPTLVMHVLDNLLGNAAKYSAPDTLIELTIGVDARGWPRVSVLDRGIGFSDGEAGQLFTPFFRSRAATQKAGGMGLGLAVCQRIIEVHGGTIEAQQRPGGGAVFTFTLPPA
jgi:PAS domain S-box-containing protein